MQCNQLTRLVKEWYLHVKNETMAPARMMQFVDQHVNDCELCQQDPDLHQEIEKIREFVLPDSKLPKAFRAPNKALTPDISPTVAAEPKPEEAVKGAEPASNPDNPTPEI
jgi:hypothetical protein